MQANSTFGFKESSIASLYVLEHRIARGDGDAHNWLKADAIGTLKLQMHWIMFTRIPGAGSIRRDVQTLVQQYWHGTMICNLSLINRFSKLNVRAVFCSQDGNAALVMSKFERLRLALKLQILSSVLQHCQSLQYETDLY